MAAPYATLSESQARDYYLDVFLPLGNVPPSWSGNVAKGDAGTLGAGYQAAVLARFNAFRYMAGLPDNVTLNPTFNTRAQAAALMMSANRQLSHTPPSTWIDYTDEGRLGAGSSNLFLGASGVGAIDGYMHEDAPAGHRRWILFPPEAQIGIGDIPTPDGDYPTANATYVIGGFGKRPDVPFVAWPPAAYTPWQLVPSAWSFAVDGAADYSQATVSVQRDGVAQNVTVKSRGLGYGDPALEWTVDGASADRANADSTYVVTIHGVLVGGQSHDYTYTTTIFDSTPTWFEVAKDFDFTFEDAGSMAVTVLREGDSSKSVSVSYATIDGSATAGLDYTAQQGTLSFGPGETSKTVTIPLTNDGVDAAYWEGFHFALTNPSRGTELGSKRDGYRVIGDSDGVHTWLNFKVAGVHVAEGSGSVSLEVTRGGSTTDTDVSISYDTFDGTAKAGQDYQKTSGTLRFAPGILSRTITVPILNDALYDPDETFRVFLSSPTGGAHDGEYDQKGERTTVTIDDDDPTESTLGFSSATFQAAEGARAVRLEVTRGGKLGTEEVTVDYTTEDGSAVAGSDFTPTTGTLHFAAGQPTATIVVPILDDSQVEPDETFRVRLSSPTGGVTLSAVSTATVTIRNDDLPSPPPTLSFAHATLSVVEGSKQAVITVVRDGDTSSWVEVAYYLTPGTACPATDYDCISKVIMFAPGETTETSIVTLVNDSRHENTESFAIHLISPTNGAKLGPVKDATITILDDDPTPPTVVKVRGVRSQAALTQLVVDFSDAMDPASAAKFTSYTIQSAGPDARFGTKDDRTLKIARAAYDASHHRVTLILAQPFGLREPVRLVAKAASLVNRKGLHLDGDNDGTPGGDAVRLLST